MVYNWMNDIPLAIILPNTIERPLTGIPFRIPFNGIPLNGIPLAIILPNTIERPLIGILLNSIPLAIILPNTIERPLTGVPLRIPFNGIPLAIILYYQIGPTIERPLTSIPFRIPFRIPLAILLPNTIQWYFNGISGWFFCKGRDLVHYHSHLREDIYAFHTVGLCDCFHEFVSSHITRPPSKYDVRLNNTA